jgi:hypothetical protein
VLRRAQGRDGACHGPVRPGIARHASRATAVQHTAQPTSVIPYGSEQRRMRASTQPPARNASARVPVRVHL